MASPRKHQPAPVLQRVFGYARVSTDRQADSNISLDEQERRITARCTENGWQLQQVFIDSAVSGSVPLNKRPQGSQLLAALRPGDVVIASRMDRCFDRRSMRWLRSRALNAARSVCGYWTSAAMSAAMGSPS